LRDNQNPMLCVNQTCQSHWAACYVGVHRSLRMLAAKIRVKPGLRPPPLVAIGLDADRGREPPLQSLLAGLIVAGSGSLIVAQHFRRRARSLWAIIGPKVKVQRRRSPRAPDPTLGYEFRHDAVAEGRPQIKSDRAGLRPWRSSSRVGKPGRAGRPRWRNEAQKPPNVTGPYASSADPRQTRQLRCRHVLLRRPWTFLGNSHEFWAVLMVRCLARERPSMIATGVFGLVVPSTFILRLPGAYIDSGISKDTRQ
jgi:hypothetical protein